MEKLPFRMARFSHTESRLLIDRYNFHCAPMFLMYKGGKLLFCSATLGTDGVTRSDLEYAIDKAQKDADKGNFLPEDFCFGVGAGQKIDQGDGHDWLQSRSTDLGAMLDAGRARRNAKD